MEAHVPRYLLVCCEGDMLGQGLVALLRLRGNGLRVSWRPPAQVLASTGAIPDCVLLLASGLWSRRQVIDTVRALSLGGSAVVVVSRLATSEDTDAVVAAGAVAHLGAGESPEVLVAVLDRVLAALPPRRVDDPSATAVARAGATAGSAPRPLAAGRAGSTAEGPRPSLSVQEQRVLELYVDGLTIAATARRMGISSHTVVTYLRRVRAKFAACGHPAPSAVDLYRAAVHLGVLSDRQFPARTG